MEGRNERRGGQGGAEDRAAKKQNKKSEQNKQTSKQTNDPEKQKQSESGGLTIDATGAENHCTILVIEPSPIEKDMLWVSTDDGRVHITQNGGSSWLEVTKNIKDLPTGSSRCAAGQVTRRQRNSSFPVQRVQAGHRGLAVALRRYLGLRVGQEIDQGIRSFRRPEG